MQLQFRRQQFQTDAANAVCAVFAGQPKNAPTYRIDPGKEPAQESLAPGAQDTPVQGGLNLNEHDPYVGYANARIVLDDATVLKQIQSLQRAAQMRPSETLDGHYNLTIEMETGVGKTYTYIKTMYELNARYGWSKFIIVVPSVAIREGVHKTFQITEEHFAEEYGKKIRYFIYNSKQLTAINDFASSDNINVMIINVQAFNARGKDARRISMELDAFRSRRPIDILARTNPILIIDEPQSVEGTVTKEKLKEFTPLMTLRYSATHPADSIYNMIYRLDALDAYNRRLVKKIAVKGLSVVGSTGTEGYVYLQSINLSKKAPTATIEFDVKGKTGIRKAVRTVGRGFNLFAQSGGLEAYADGYIIDQIDARDTSFITFTNGKRLYVGDVIGTVAEEQLRRIQIRETILSHLERERALFGRGVKVLSLFFIDEVTRYRAYDASGNAASGEYAHMFEEEYRSAVAHMQLALDESPDYQKYLSRFDADAVHAGYFSVDKKSGHMVNSRLSSRRSDTSDDIDAYDLIMKNKERLLDFDEPVRLIFSHSALREGWDNPNVFQICTLKQSGSEVRKRQEVGRGLRLAVNQAGERMDENILASGEIHEVNLLTVIASESYEDFARGLQDEIAAAVADRPQKVDAALFTPAFGADTAAVIHEELITNGYVHRGRLTEKYERDKEDGIVLPPELEPHRDQIMAVLDTVYNPAAALPEDARRGNVEVTLDTEKMSGKAFRELWSRINGKSYYTVHFDEQELTAKAIHALDAHLTVSRLYVNISTGMQADTLTSKQQLTDGTGFTQGYTVREEIAPYGKKDVPQSVRYDLVGKLTAETGLTRHAIVSILTGMKPTTFDLFRMNPEEFILRTARLINEQKATAIIEHVSYNKLEEHYSTDIFTAPELRRGVRGVNAMPAERHLYDHVIYDSTNEKEFAEKLEEHRGEVEVYVKLPRGFYISTPVGRYNPDWAIAFRSGKVKHVYFVAETKGSMSSLQLRAIEQAKKECAAKHFRAVSGEGVTYSVVSDYEKLWEIVRG